MQVSVFSDLNTSKKIKTGMVVMQDNWVLHRWEKC